MADTEKALRQGCSGAGEGSIRRIFSPSFLRGLYKTFTYKPAATNQNVLGVPGFSEDYPSPADLAEFMGRFRSDGADATFSIEQIHGGMNDPDKPYPRGEAWTTPRLPQTISASYANYEKSVQRGHAGAVFFLFAQLGARGVSVLFASGDRGVGQVELKTNGNVRFVPTYPTTCPYLTSVGGTTGRETEVAASFSSGGFSVYFLRLDYQDEAMSTFFQDLGDKYHGLYHASSRGFPVIASRAIYHAFIFRGKLRGTEGTSCATLVIYTSILKKKRNSRPQWVRHLSRGTLRECPDAATSAAERRIVVRTRKEGRSPTLMRSRLARYGFSIPLLSGGIHHGGPRFKVARMGNEIKRWQLGPQQRREVQGQMHQMKNQKGMKSNCKGGRHEITAASALARGA
ncbi:peptidase S8/S53 domain-containing protein [Lactarius psammicola]|nr:peptidase S8/S53 domain-containing protein [Lactarius psammicola]